ncbi:MAG TPA: hypothetical protein VM715_07085, partial [Candidatus Acidoferrum sp.]|nr:hypothetical protein [Candidatus Acidoferrum sp.]
MLLTEPGPYHHVTTWGAKSKSFQPEQQRKNTSADLWCFRTGPGSGYARLVVPYLTDTLGLIKKPIPPNRYRTCTILITTRDHDGGQGPPLHQGFGVFLCSAVDNSDIRGLLILQRLRRNREASMFPTR